MRKASVCAECSGPLALFYDLKQHKAYLACNDYLRTGHTGIEREHQVPFSETPEGRLLGKIPRWRLEEMGDKGKALAQYQSVTLTEEKAKEVIKTLWPKAPEAERIKAAMICTQYGLNPLMNHLYLIKYKTKDGDRWVDSWQIVLGIKATRFMASSHGRYSYLDDTPRLMTPKEQERVFGEKLDDRLTALTVVKDERGNLARGYGVFRKADAVKGEDKGNTKANMAFIRSERQALDRLFPGAMPADMDVVDEEFMDTDSGPVDTETGEIVEGSFSVEDEVVDSTRSESAPEPQEPPQGKVFPLQIGIDFVRASLEKLGRKEEDTIMYLSSKYHVQVMPDLEQALVQLDELQQDDFRLFLKDKVEQLGDDEPLF